MTTSYKVKNLRMRNSLKQIEEISMIQDKVINLDFSSMKIVRTSGMILFVAGIETLKKQGYSFYCDKNKKYLGDKNNYAISYSKHVGFFDALGFDIGKKMGEAVGSRSYFPINKIKIKELYKSDFLDYHEGIRDYSNELSEVLTTDIPEFKNVFTYLITEIIRNTFEHTSSEHVWISAQRHNHDGYIEVSIADNAEGIKQVITVNKELDKKIQTDIDALRLAIKPGISGNAKYQNNHEDYWNNSGYGLYVTSEILSMIGSFKLISGEAILDLNEQEVESDCTVHFKGTAVILEIDIEKARNVSSKIIHDVVLKGESMAKNDNEAIKTASKSSRMEPI